jgi:DNA-binding response OmpR family regulator
VRILIIEDDDALARGLVAALRQSGYAVDHQNDGSLAVELALSEPYSLAVVDLGLPGKSGLQVIKELRQQGCTVPIMILTARDGIDDRVKGLDLGADDYMAKPFDLGEFEARVRALVRRANGSASPVLSCANLTLDRSAGFATLDGRPLDLRRRELAVLAGLMTRAGKLVTKERLIDETFGFDEPVAPNAIELYIGRLRKKLEPDGPEIKTVRGLGYLLVAR